MAQQNDAQKNDKLEFIQSLSVFNDFINYCVEEESKVELQGKKLNDLVKGYNQSHENKLIAHWQTLMNQKDKIQNADNSQAGNGKRLAFGLINAVDKLLGNVEKNQNVENQNNEGQEAENNLAEQGYSVQDLLDCQLIINKTMSKELNKILIENNETNKKIKNAIDQMNGVLENNKPVNLEEVQKEPEEENINNNNQGPNPQQPDELANAKNELAEKLNTCLQNVQEQQRGEFIKQFTAFNKLMNHCANKFGKDGENKINPYVEKSFDDLAKDNNLSPEEKTAAVSFIENYGKSIKDKAKQNLLPNLEPKDVDNLLDDWNLLLKGDGENRNYPPIYNREKLLSCQALINSSIPKDIVKLLDTGKNPDQEIKNSIEQINNLVENGIPIGKEAKKEEEKNDEEIKEDDINNDDNKQLDISEINTCLTNIQNHVKKYSLIDSFNIFNDFMNKCADECGKEENKDGKELGALISSVDKAKLSSACKCIQKTISQKEAQEGENEENPLDDGISNLLTQLINLTENPGQQQKEGEKTKYKLEDLVNIQWKINKLLLKQVQEQNEELNKEINALTEQIKQKEEGQPEQQNKEKPPKGKLIDKRAELSKKKMELGNIINKHLKNAEQHVSDIKKEHKEQKYKEAIDNFKNKLTADKEGEKGLITLLKAIQAPLNNSVLDKVNKLKQDENTEGSLAYYIKQIDKALENNPPNFDAISDYLSNVASAFKEIQQLSKSSNLGQAYSKFEAKYKEVMQEEPGKEESKYWSEVNQIKKIGQEIKKLGAQHLNNVNGNKDPYESYKKIIPEGKAGKALESKAKTMEDRLKERIGADSDEALDLILSVLSGKDQEKEENQEVSDMDLLLSAFEQYGKLNVKVENGKANNKDAKKDKNENIEQAISQQVMQKIIQTSLSANSIGKLDDIFYKSGKNGNEEQEFDKDKIKKVFDNLNEMSKRPEFQKALKNMMSDEKTINILTEQAEQFVKGIEDEKAKDTKLYKFKNFLKENYWNWDSESKWYKNLGKNIGKMALFAGGAVLYAWQFGALATLLAVNPMIGLWIGLIAIAGIVLVPLVIKAVWSGIKYIARKINKNWQWAQPTPEVDKQKYHREALRKYARQLDFVANFFDIDVELFKQEGIDFEQLNGGKAVITAKDEKQKKFLETLLKLYEADEKSASDRGYTHEPENQKADQNENNGQVADQNNNNINIQNQNEDNNNHNMNQNGNVQGNQNNQNNAHKYQDNGTGIKPLGMLKEYLKKIQSEHKIKLKDIKVKVPKQQEQKKTK